MSSSTSVRPVEPADIEAVIGLDQGVTGKSRRGFYRKRFDVAKADPDRFVWLVASQDGRVAGFVSAQILDGEYGNDARAAVVDAIGTLPERRGTGLGRILMEALEADLRKRRVTEIRSEADWTEQTLVGFFAKAGFALAPQLVLACDCSAATDF